MGRSAEDKAAVPAEFLVPEPRAPRERKSVEKYDAGPADTASKKRKASMTPKAKKPSKRELAIADAESRLVDGPPMDRCRAVLDLMALRDEDAFWFEDPVPTGEDGIPDYLDVIKQPMDYSTVRSNLVDGNYGDDPVAFAADMRLIYTNAVTYNWKPDHQVHQAARACLRAFEHHFSRSRGLDVGPLVEGDGGASGGGKTPASGGKAKAAEEKVAGKKRKSSVGGSSSGGGPADAAGASSSPAAGASSSMGAAPAKKRGRPAGDRESMDESERAVRLLQNLGEYLEACGGSQSMVDGWYTKTEYRKEGATAGTYDSYFFSPQGKVRARVRVDLVRRPPRERAPVDRFSRVTPSLRAVTLRLTRFPRIPPRFSFSFSFYFSFYFSFSFSFLCGNTMQPPTPTPTHLSPSISRIWPPLASSPARSASARRRRSRAISTCRPRRRRARPRRPRRRRPRRLLRRRRR